MANRSERALSAGWETEHQQPASATGSAQPVPPSATGSAQLAAPLATGSAQSVPPPITGSAQLAAPSATGSAEPAAPPKTGSAQPAAPPKTGSAQPAPSATDSAQPAPSATGSALPAAKSTGSKRRRGTVGNKAAKAYRRGVAKGKARSDIKWTKWLCAILVVLTTGGFAGGFGLLWAQQAATDQRFDRLLQQQTAIVQQQAVANQRIEHIVQQQAATNQRFDQRFDQLAQQQAATNQRIEHIAQQQAATNQRIGRVETTMDGVLQVLVRDGLTKASTHPARGQSATTTAVDTRARAAPRRPASMPTATAGEAMAAAAGWPDPARAACSGGLGEVGASDIPGLQAADEIPTLGEDILARAGGERACAPLAGGVNPELAATAATGPAPAAGA